MGILLFVYIKYVKFHLFFVVFDRIKKLDKEIKLNLMFDQAYKLQEKLFKKYLMIYKYLFIFLFLWILIVGAFLFYTMEHRVGYFEEGYEEIQSAISITLFNIFLIFAPPAFLISYMYDYLSKFLKKFQKIKEKYILCFSDDLYLPQKITNVYFDEKENVKKYNSKWFIKKYKGNALIMYYFFLVNIINDQYINQREINIIINDFIIFLKEKDNF
ncbi:hypothetical protein [Mycoplasma leonicaptivi]|uniref:hypothetical protein n=1 Tax=Mycoplasma leonicaptivi TaxID=36742 RepID=UPI0004824309|nr:hypothetical protein [Mycoplasma leonicaptivi]